MSQQYDNTNSGALFKNDRKETERHPDYRGSLNVGGKDFWISAWLKEGRNGKYMSLSVQPKEPRQETGDRQRQDYTSNYGPAQDQGGFSGPAGDPEIPF